jgi:serine/threonine protein kinase/Tol biopolymer transport system component
MGLKPGQRLGPYEIESPIGAGGMGEVYLARDTRLDRAVAIKVLPSQLAENSLRRERFEREARAVSALTHPHICALFDVGEEDGVSFLVMEHLEGESLADRLARGALPLDKVLKIGAQVASALDRAHRAGIVHRDLKPGNVMLTKGGAKLLDFGLAKNVPGEHEPTESSAPTESAPRALSGASEAPTEARPDLLPIGSETPTELKPDVLSLGSEAPTEARPGATPLGSKAPTDAKPLTEAGTVLGTFQYMAPEQLEGEEADGRADIWALGCLLYEMATGRAPFLGKSQASLISAIMRDIPAPVTDRQPLTPSSLDHVISRCLEKDRDDRWQSARDVAQELSWIQSSGSRREEAGAPGPPASTRPGPGWAAAGVGFLAAVGLGVVAGRGLGTGPAEDAGVAVPFAQQLTFHKGVERHPALSPDGKQLAYVSDASGNDDIYLQRVDGRNALNLTESSLDPDSEPSFSPDGSQIAFRSERGGGGIFVMGATGESVRRVADRGHNPSWSPDGSRLVVSTERIIDPMSRQGLAELWIVDVATGQSERLYAGDAVQPAWSPDGQRIAFWRVDHNSGQRDLATITPQGGEPLPVTMDAPVDWNPVWAPDGGSLLFVSDRGGTMNLWRVPIDPETGSPRAEPVLVGAPAQEVAWLSAASKEGSVAYESRSAVHYVYSLPVDPEALRPAGELQTIYAGALPVSYTHPSPDGTQIAMTTRGAREDLYVMRADGEEVRQLTNDPFRDRGPQWSPDASQIAFYSNRSGTYQIWTIRPDGSGLRQLTEVPDGAWFPYWSPDGSQIAFPTGKSTCIITVGEAPVSDARCLPDLSETHWFEVRDWSHDGRWLVGSKALKTGQVVNELLVWSVEAEEYQPLEAHGLVARWLPDARHLVLLDEEGRPVIFDRSSGAVSDLDASTVDGFVDGEQLGVSRDGGTVLVRSNVLESNVWLLSFPDAADTRP